MKTYIETFRTDRRTKWKTGGFTITELIAVMVIMVILLIFLVPRYVEFVNHAKAETVLTDAHIVLSSAQSVAYEFYAQGEPVESELDHLGLNPKLLERIMELSMIEDENGRIIDLQYNKKTWQVSYLDYTNGTYEGIYDGRNWSTSKYVPKETTAAAKK